MKTSFINTLKIVILGVLLAGGISYASTWVAPTQPPIGGNPDAPINISGTGQIKLGGLTLGAGTGVSQALTVLNGKSGFGFSSLPSNLLVDVNGSLGAKQYCDEKGEHCVSGAELGGSGNNGGNGGDGSGGGNGGNTASKATLITGGVVDLWDGGVLKWGTGAGVNAAGNLRCAPGNTSILTGWANNAAIAICVKNGTYEGDPSTSAGWVKQY